MSSKAWLLGVITGVFLLVVAALLLANRMAAVGAYVDAPFFQHILIILICFMVSAALFGFLEGSTASFQLPAGVSAAISLGGPIAAFAALYFLIFPGLAPTTSVYLTFVEAASISKAGQVFHVPGGVDVRVTLDAGSIEKRSTETDVSFSYLPKGVDLPISFDSLAWEVAGITPPECAASTSNNFAVKAGCRAAFIAVARSKDATFARLRDLPPINLSFDTVSLRTAVDTLVQELQISASARDKNAIIEGPRWSEVPGHQKTFKWSSPPAQSGPCVTMRYIERAYNQANPKSQIYVTATETEVVIQPQKSKGRPNDDCWSP
jgi:hypothetical protein